MSKHSGVFNEAYIATDRGRGILRKDEPTCLNELAELQRGPNCGCIADRSAA